MDFQKSIEELRLRVEKAGPGIVTITAYDSTGAESGKGSGFFIDQEGQIITNADVMKDAYSAEVLSESNQYNSVTLLGCNEDLDLALLKVEAVDERPLDIDLDYEIKNDEKVDIIGKTDDSTITVSEGSIISISSIEKDLELIEILIHIPISRFKAAKDGPLLNLAGKVIGMTTAALPVNSDPLMRMDYNDKSINAISMHSIKHFILNPGSDGRLHSAKSKIWHKWLIKQMKEISVIAFIILYTLGFPKVLAILLAIILFISLIQWIYLKQKKKWARG